MKKALFVGLLLFAVSGAEVLTTIVQKQVILSGATPGQMLIVAADGIHIAAAPMPTPAAQMIIGTPAAPGCTATATAGQYQFPQPVTTVEVWRNGLKASLTGEYSVTGNTLTIADPIPGEVVLCNYR